MITLKVSRDSYIECKECMFLSPTLFEIKKHGSNHIWCSLFGEQLQKNDNGLPEPCNACSELEGEDDE